MFVVRALLVTTLISAITGPALAQSSAKGEEPSFQDRPLSAWVQDLTGAAAPYSRLAAAYAISSMGAAGAPAVPALIRSLKDDNNAVRYASAIALREIGPPAAAAVPALQEAREDRNDDVAHMARKALLAITGEPSE